MATRNMDIVTYRYDPAVVRRMVCLAVEASTGSLPDTAEVIIAHGCDKVEIRSWLGQVVRFVTYRDGDVWVLSHGNFGAHIGRPWFATYPNALRLAEAAGADIVNTATWEERLAAGTGPATLESLRDEAERIMQADKYRR